MTTRPAPFLIDKAIFSLLVVPDENKIRMSLNVLRFCADRTVVATNGHYLAVVRPDHTPDPADFPSHGALDGATYAGGFEAFSLDADGLKSVAKVMKPCKQLPILSYALVIPPIEGERTCTVLVALNGDPGNVARFNVPVSDQRYPDFGKVTMEPGIYLKGSVGNINLNRDYITEIMGIAKAVDKDHVGVTLSFTKVGSQMMFTGSRFMAILMPMRGDNEAKKDNTEAAAAAKAMRSGFTYVNVGGIDIPIVAGASVTYGTPVVPLPRQAQAA